MTAGPATPEAIRAELEETARTYLTNAKHHGDDCPFCNGEVKALMQLADAYAQAAVREQAGDDGRHPDGCACQFCREDEREERERADRQDADDDGYPDSERDMDALAYQRNGDDERDQQ